MLITSIFVVWGVISPLLPKSYTLTSVTDKTTKFLSVNFGWAYVLVMFLLVLVAMYIIISPIGKTRIGGDDAKPEYSTFAWISMLFSAGMGIGLVFWGVSEPLMHYSQLQEIGTIGSNDTITPVVYSFVHWGIQPWVLYGIMALIIAYFMFNKQSKALISETISPIIKFKNRNILLKLIDILIIVATIFGVATSLGLGAIQIGGGIEYILPNISNTFTLQLIIIAVVTVVFIYSSISGLQKGMKSLSTSAIVGSIILMILVLFLGPTLTIIETLIQATGNYLGNFIEYSLDLGPTNPEKRVWINAWKIFYWSWWISWAPYVSSFIARISKGRTFKEFLIGVIAVPTLFAMIWFSVFGATALYDTSLSTGTVMSVMNNHGPESAFFALFGLFKPFSTVLSIVGIIIIAIFFITSANSATFVIAMFADDGEPVPKNRDKVFWGLLVSIVAIILLAAGSLSTLQAVSILASFPVLFILILMIISFFKEIKSSEIK